jgi:hypothetical protein
VRVKRREDASARQSRSTRSNIAYRRNHTGSPFRDYCGEWGVSTVRQLTAHDIPSLLAGGRVPASEIVGGFTPNISDYAQFNWYEYVWIYDPTVQFPADARKLARWIGVAHDVGNPPHDVLGAPSMM